jgi:uncharacterized cupredoxin-like copper-binding protein
MIRSRYIVLPTAAACALAVAAAGASGEVTAAKLKHSGSLKAAANGDLKFNKKKITVKHGKVTLTMKNPKGSGLDHGIAIDGNGVDKDGNIVGPGKTSTVSIKLKPGTYSFYCPVTGHRAAGMKGKLIVK